LAILQNKFRTPTHQSIVNNLQIVKQDLSNVYKFKLPAISDRIDKISSLTSLSELENEIEKLIDYLKEKIDGDALVFKKKFMSSASSKTKKRNSNFVNPYDKPLNFKM
jgi:hypothetical protein